MAPKRVLGWQYCGRQNEQMSASTCKAQSELDDNAHTCLQVSDAPEASEMQGEAESTRWSMSCFWRELCGPPQNGYTWRDGGGQPRE